MHFLISLNAQQLPAISGVFSLSSGWKEFMKAVETVYESDYFRGVVLK